jgi:hypothetical protein
LIGAEHGHLLHVQAVDLSKLCIEEGERGVVREADEKAIHHVGVGPVENRHVQNVSLNGANPGCDGSEGTGAVGDLDNKLHELHEASIRARTGCPTRA